MEVFKSRRARDEAILAAVIISVVTIGAFHLFRPYINTFLNLETLKVFLNSLGIYAPIGIVLLQSIQIIFAALPPLTPVASGYMFGPIMGTVYIMIGSLIGSWTAITIGRRYGQETLERFVSEDFMDRFHHFTEGYGITPFLVLFLFPGFPDDALCFLAGLTDLDKKKLVISATFGRLPGVFAAVLAGSSLANSNTSMLITVTSILVASSLIGKRYEEKIIAYAESLEKESMDILELIVPNYILR